MSAFVARVHPALASAAAGSPRPPSNIASYPFQPVDADIRKIRHQLDLEKPGEAHVEGEEFDLQ